VPSGDRLGLGHEQWPSGTDRSAKEVASLIRNWLTSVSELGEMIIDGLFAALESAPGYIAAGETAERIAELDSLTQEQWTRLDEIYWRNDQLYHGVLPTRALRRMYQWHGREWPPPKPSPSGDASAARVSAGSSPF
jgi:hypothetical protein